MWRNRTGSNIARALAQAPKVEKLLDSYERQARKQGASEVLGVINKFKGAAKATKALMNTSKYLLEKSDKSKSMHNVAVEGKKENAIERVDTLISKMDKIINGGKGSGNFGHSGRPGEVGGSGPSGRGGNPTGKKSRESRIREAIAESIASQKKLQDKAKVVREDIEDRIGQKVKEGEEYTALDEAHKSRFKYFHGEDGTEYTYDKGNGMITKTNPETGDQEIVTKKKEAMDKKASQEYAYDRKMGSESLESKVDKALGKEKIKQGKTKAEDDANYKKFEKDIDKLYKILSKEKSKENFGQAEIRRLEDKWADYLSGNWSVTGRFQKRLREFEDWADNYQNW